MVRPELGEPVPPRLAVLHDCETVKQDMRSTKDGVLMVSLLETDCDIVYLTSGAEYNCKARFPVLPYD